MKKNKLLITTILFVILSLLINNCFAVNNLKILFTHLSDEDFNSLPMFLQDRVMYHNTHEKKYLQKWESVYGKDFIHYHHYALALVFLNRAKKENNTKKKKRNLERAISELDYMLKFCTPKHNQRFKFHYFKGEAYLYLGNYAEAGTQFSETIKYRPEFAPPYLLLAQVYRYLKMPDSAAEMQSTYERLVGGQK